MRIINFIYTYIINGGLAQLARASDLHSEGHRFDSDILHDCQASDGPFVYRLGHNPFTVERGVRFPYGLQIVFK
jgi:hypothetical protein